MNTLGIPSQVDSALVVTLLGPVVGGLCNRCRDDLRSWLWLNGMGETSPVVGANVFGREWL